MKKPSAFVECTAEEIDYDGSGFMDGYADWEKGLAITGIVLGSIGVLTVTGVGIAALRNRSLHNNVAVVSPETPFSLEGGSCAVKDKHYSVLNANKESMSVITLKNYKITDNYIN